MKRIRAAGAAFVLSIIAPNVAAQTASPDRVQNIEKAAAEIAAIQKAGGANGAFAAIIECYKRELPGATALTPQLEACMAQDIIVSQVTVAFYSGMSAEGRKLVGVDPDAVKKAMLERVVGTTLRFHVPQDDALVFSGIVKTKGMEAYARASFPDQFPEKKDSAQPTDKPSQVANNAGDHPQMDSVLPWLPVPGSGEASDAVAARGERCLKDIQNTAAVTTDSKVRFGLHMDSHGVEEAEDAPPDVVLHSEPDRFSKAYFLCNRKNGPSGAIRVGALQVRLDGAPYYSGKNKDLGYTGSQFIATYADASPGWLQRSHKGFLDLGGLLPRGEYFGLSRYQQVMGVKDKKLLPNAVFLGAHFVGASPGRHFVDIECSVFELSKNYLCRLREEIRDNVTLSVELAPESVPNWARYAEIAEQYFETHLESPTR